MVKKETIVKNFSWMFISEIIANLLSFIIVIIIARYLGDAGLGKYSYAFAFANIALIFTEVGFNQFIIREVSRNKKNTKKIFGNILTIKLISSSLVIIFSAVILLFTEPSLEIITIVLIATVATVIYYVGSLYKCLMVAYEIMEYESWAKIFERVMLIAAVLLLLWNKASIIVLVAAYLIVYTFVSILRFWIVTKKVGLIAPKADFIYWIQIIVISLPFYISGIFITLSFKLEVFLLTKLHTFNVVGWYDAASKLVDGLSFFPGILVIAVYPAMSQLYKRSKDMLHILFTKSFKYLYMIALPVAVGTSILGQRIINFIYGEKFINSGIVLQIVIWAEFFIFLNYLNGYLLNSINKQKLFMISSIVSVAVNIIIGFILIKNFSYIGAAITSVVVHVTNFFIMYSFTKKEGYGVSVRMLWKPLLASVIMACVILLMSKIHLLIVIPVAFVSYFLTLIIIKEFGREEIEMIRTFIKKQV